MSVDAAHSGRYAPKVQFLRILNVELTPAALLISKVFEVTNWF